MTSQIQCSTVGCKNLVTSKTGHKCEHCRQKRYLILILQHTEERRSKNGD